MFDNLDQEDYHLFSSGVGYGVVILYVMLYPKTRETTCLVFLHNLYSLIGWKI